MDDSGLCDEERRMDGWRLVEEAKGDEDDLLGDRALIEGMGFERTAIGHFYW